MVRHHKDIDFEPVLGDQPRLLHLRMQHFEFDTISPATQHVATRRLHNTWWPSIEFNSDALACIASTAGHRQVLSSKAGLERIGQKHAGAQAVRAKGQ